MEAQRKLPKEAAEKLRICPIDTVRPCALMMAPAYVYMRLNEKYVMVKGALDFFDAEELRRLKPMESFFFPEEVETALLFRKAAANVRALLKLGEDRGNRDTDLRVTLAPASYEISDAVIRVLAPLWRDDSTIDPFFVAIFSNELCELLPAELLRETRDRDIASFERAVVASGWAVFLALHLGHCDLGFLNRLRLKVFREVAGYEEGMGAAGDTQAESELQELVRTARRMVDALAESGELALPGSSVSAHTEEQERSSMKLASRLLRVRRAGNG